MPHRWRWHLFLLVAFFRLSSAQLTLISAPCLQSCFIKLCENLESGCVCNTVPKIPLSMAIEACGDGGAALRALGSECRVFTRIASPTRTLRGPIRATTSDKPQPQPVTVTAGLPQILNSATTINTPAATARPNTDQAPLAPPPRPAPQPSESILAQADPATTSSAPKIIPPSSNVLTETSETKARIKNSVIIVIALSVVSVFLGCLFVWYRRKMGPSWYKFGTNKRWDFAAWKKERERNKSFGTKKRRGSIKTFMGPPPEYETRLAWDFPAPPEHAQLPPGLARPQMAQVRIPR